VKIVYISGTEVGVEIYNAIYEAGFEVDTIFTYKLEKRDVISGFFDYEKISKSSLVRVDNINEEVEAIKKINPDLIIVGGWQQLLSKEVLDIPKLGTIGFHSSLLPNYRGRAPVNWALIMGERKTGITMFYLTPNADDGDIIAQKEVEILFNDDCNSVYKKCAKAGAKLIKTYLPQIKEGTAPKIHNPSKSYPVYPKRRPEEGLIDFNRSSLDIYNFVRALTKPYPGAFTFLDGKKIVIYKVEIVMDESRLRDEDLVFETKDFKIRAIEWEYLQ
jgi:methionyl-tRNA formyltransferase